MKETNKFQEKYLDLLVYLSSKRRGIKARLKKSLLRLKRGLEQEGVETREMFSIYGRYTKGLATKEEMVLANKQFVEILKGLGVGVLLVLPFAPLTLPFVVKLGQRLGIDIIPSSFSDRED
ncbi:hypothetical protein [Halobacteriovorax sp. DPLXC-1]|uniref:hypothetical protein n=1 Tax=Halobacteriovorax sp. DPLXC-1 TaxID=3110771 RepID=UPI002FF11609